MCVKGNDSGDPGGAGGLLVRLAEGQAASERNAHTAPGQCRELPAPGPLSQPGPPRPSPGSEGDALLVEKWQLLTRCGAVSEGGGSHGRGLDTSSGRALLVQAGSS